MQITRRLEFDAAHRIVGHEGKCRHLHGHRYAVEVTLDAAYLDGLGRVIDFSHVKGKLADWIDNHLDHNVILSREDPLARLWQQMAPEDKLDADGLFARRKPYLMPYSQPTAENLAALLFEKCRELFPELVVVRVRVYETPNCWADYTGPGGEGKNDV